MNDTIFYSLLVLGIIVSISILYLFFKRKNDSTPIENCIPVKNSKSEDTVECNGDKCSTIYHAIPEDQR